MLRRKIGTALASCGIVMIFFGAGALPAQGAEPMHVALQPSPRPALDSGHHSSGSNGASSATGHVTGTVIDLRTGAPVPGVSVNVGGDIVTTDSNGNYDHWLVVGSYAVALDLKSGQGDPAQASAMVVVEPGVATIQHLTFTSPAPAASRAPSEPAAAPTAAASVAAPKPVAQPARLPRTGSDSSPAWLWLGVGLMLLMAGGMVGFSPILQGKSAARLLHMHALNTRLLQSLLTVPLPISAAPKTGDELLAALLNHDAQQKGGTRQR